MKIKRKRYSLIIILERVLCLRFPEIQKLMAITATSFQIELATQRSFTSTVQLIDLHVGHLIDEFGDPDDFYEFRIVQGDLLESTLYFGELNNKKLKTLS